MSMITPGSISHSLIFVFLTSALGLAMGSLKIYKFRLGLAGVLFMGLLFSHFGVSVNPNFLDFMREFGLILFIYTIGYQVGPGFFASFGKNTLKLNGLAASIVLLGALVTIAIAKFTQVPSTVALGLFSGATTNTPSLGAVGQMLKDFQGLTPEMLMQPDLGYALAYPFGIMGIILSLTLIKATLGLSVTSEKEKFNKEQNPLHEEIDSLNIEIKNPNINGIKISEIPSIKNTGVVISRIFHNDDVMVATSETLLFPGDIVLAIGERSKLDSIRIILGAVSATDLRTIPGQISTKRIVVTKPSAVGRSPRELDFFRKYGVTLTRVSRAEIQFTPTSRFHFQFGDRVTAVGEESALKKVADELGDSIKKLEHTEIIPFFLGIVLGLLLGSIPFYIPGMSVPIKLGMAGGPLIMAIILSRLGHVGKMIWYMPNSANLTLREFGIMMFLSCVGLKSGQHFLSTLISGEGILWIVAGAMITLIPILIIGFIAARLLKMNYLSVCGLLSGSMTDPPALAYATEITESDGPAITYASVYPLTMLLRVIAAQVLVMYLIF